MKDVSPERLGRTRRLKSRVNGAAARKRRSATRNARRTDGCGSKSIRENRSGQRAGGPSSRCSAAKSGYSENSTTNPSRKRKKSQTSIEIVSPVPRLRNRDVRCRAARSPSITSSWIAELSQRVVALQKKLRSQDRFNSLKKSLPLSSTTMKAGKSSTSIFQIASMPSSGYSSSSTFLMQSWARRAAGPPIEPR